jgi:hypothetical protein
MQARNSAAKQEEGVNEEEKGWFLALTKEEAHGIWAKREESKQSGKKRKAEAEPSSKEYRVPSPCDEDVLGEYRCPITQELPVDPVVAEDGQAYERSAIEDWFERQKGGEVKSPMTNQSIGKTLLPAVQTRSAIERLIQKGIIQGEAALTWTEKRAELMAIDKDKRPVLAKANKGHLPSMRVIGFCYRDGTHGFKKDQAKCVEWFQRGAEKDDPMCVVSLAVFYIHGNGVPRDPVRGIIELTRAAMLGSEHGAACLGNHYTSGENGLIKNESEATRWYKFSRECKTKDTVKDFRERRDTWLKARNLLDD